VNLAPGLRLGRYELVRVLGRGGMGEVWEALLHGFQGFRRKVALKLLPPTSDQREVLLREARLGALLSHPNVVATHDVGETDGRAWIAMELVTGATLRELSRDGPLGGRALVDVGLQAAAALGHIHGLTLEGRPLALLHRDVKPSNLLVDQSGLVKLADLGVARLASERGGVGGTPAYMAPEQREGHGDGRADLFGLGATLLRLATGRPLFEPGSTAAANRRALQQLVTAADAWRELDAPAPGLVEVLRRCLDPEPERRFPTAAALADALQGIRARQPAGPSLLERLARVRPELGPGDPATERGSASAPATALRPGRLPRSTDAFVGREAERAAVLGEVRAAPGLVTLLGTGGAGKTRLALEVARAAELPGGAWFVDLSEATDLEGVLHATARTFEVGLDRTDPVAQLGHALHSRGRAVVVLDNLEQVTAAAAPVFTAWLEAAPALTFLATSRVALRLPGERRVPVGPLAVPEAVELFRARAPRRLTDDEAALLPELVAELDGLPLAIELAAARVRLVPVEGIRERLIDRMRLLAGGGRDRPERHRSLRASLDASWELLTDWQQAALAQLSVFEGGWSLDAADAVLDLSAFPAAPWGLDVLEGLVDASLVRVESRGERFRMLVSVQVYAASHLTGPARDAAELRHGRWFAQLGSDVALAELYAPRAPERMALLGRELDNLAAAARRAVRVQDRPTAFAATRAAVAWLRMQGPVARAEELLALAGTLGTGGPDARSLRASGAALRRESGRTDEAISLLRRELDDGADDAVAQTALTELGIALQEAGSPDAAATHARAVELARARGDRRSEAQALANLATLEMARGERESARARFEQALGVHRELSSPRFVGMALANLGMIDASTGRRAEAAARLSEGAALLERAGDRRSALICLANLGVLALERGEPLAAVELLERSWRGQREIGARRFEAVAASQRATVLSQLGRYAEAEAALREAIGIHREQRNPGSELVAMANLADTLLRMRRFEACAALAEEVAGRAAASGSPRYEALAAATLAELHLLRGDPAAAERSLARAKAVAPAGSAESAGFVALLEARLHESRGEWAEAELAARSPLDGLRAFERARAHVLLARLARRRGDRLTWRAERDAAAALAAPFGPDSLVAAEVRSIA
jgi:predicted ATPase/Tfp pilus assembly protein PilF